MLKIYHASGTRGMRPIWLCYELGLEIEVETIDFSPAYRDSPEWRAISPTGRVPVMTDGDLVMYESGAMVDYLLERYGDGRLQPSSASRESALYRQWCWYAEATLVRPHGLIYTVRLDASTGGDSVSADAIEKVHTALAVVEEALDGSDYLLGSEFSAADIMMGYSLELLVKCRLLSESFPNARDYLARLKNREACQRAMAA